MGVITESTNTKTLKCSLQNSHWANLGDTAKKNVNISANTFPILQIPKCNRICRYWFSVIENLTLRMLGTRGIRSPQVTSSRVTLIPF